MFRLAFVAAVQTPAAGESGHGAFDDPAMTAQPGGAFLAATSDPGRDAAFTQPSPLVSVVVALIAVQLVRSSPPRPTRTADGRYALHEGLQGEAVMSVRRGNGDGDRQARPVDNQVDFRSVLAAVGRIRSRQLPPLRALTLTESMAQRDQSSSPRAPSSSRMTRCSRAHTRALDHWAKRR